MSGHSYRQRLSLPAFGLYTKDDELVATTRAEGAEEAKELFRTYDYVARGARALGLSLEGARVKRLGND